MMLRSVLMVKYNVAGYGNTYVQVLNPDWTLSHGIDGRVSGDDYWFSSIAFNLSGDVHETTEYGSSVLFLTPNGQFVCRYDADPSPSDPYFSTRCSY